MENLNIEYKAELSRDVLSGLDGDIAAFANTKGGEIWFGVDDQGRPTGVRLVETDRQQIAQKAGRCRPPISVDLKDREYEGHTITVVVVPESSSIHADERHRFPIRTGGIKDYLDAVGILLLARERGLEFAASSPAFNWPSPGPQTERRDLPPEFAKHFAGALATANPIIRTEALKDLEPVVYRYRLERDAEIMDLLIELAGRLADSAEGRPLDLLRFILLQADDEDRDRWLRKVRARALSLCAEGSSVFRVQQALNFLGQFAEPEDIDKIVWLISSWPKEIYSHARPFSWLDDLKRKGWCPDSCGNREVAHSSGWRKSNHQSAVRQDGRRRNAPWRSVSGRRVEAMNTRRLRSVN